MQQQNQLLAVLWAFFALTTLTMGLRCYVRLGIVKSFGIDDWFMLIGYGGFASLVAVLVTSIHYGLGQHATALAPSDQINAAKYLIIGELIYIVGSGFIKISVGLLFLRITATQIHRYIIHASIVIIAVWTTATFLAVAVQCRTLRLAWNYVEGEGTCMDPLSVTSLGYGFSALDIGSDWLYALLPIAMLWHVQMTWKLKASVCIVLGFGVVASVATIIRLQYLVALTDQADVLYAICVTQMWTVIEVGIGMTAGCIATLRPLLRQLNITGLGSTDPRSGKSRGLHYRSGSYHQTQELGYVKQHSSNAQSTSADIAGHGDHSQELILENGPTIYKTADVSVIRSDKF